MPKEFSHLAGVLFALTSSCGILMMRMSVPPERSHEIPLESTVALMIAVAPTYYWVGGTLVGEFNGWRSESRPPIAKPLLDEPQV